MEAIVRARSVPLAAGLALVAGCYLSHERARDGGPDAGMPDARVLDSRVDAPRPLDAGPDAYLPDAQHGGPVECDAGPVILDAGGRTLLVDLLFVVDNSGSMDEEQVALTRELPRLVRMLATGDLDEDGRAEFEPVTDLRVGVLTTEVATGFPSEGCTVSLADGDDGALRTHGYWWHDECRRSYPRFLGYRPSDGPAARFVTDLGCVAYVGNEGCGIEQPLEAMLKALTPSGSTDVAFPVGTGRGDLDNAGFVRDGSILAVVLVTDENDCSLSDVDLANPESTRYPIDPETVNLRCFLHPEALTPTERYVDGLRRLRPEDPDSILFAAITGVPPDLVTDPTRIDYDALLADPRMLDRPNPARPDRLVPACDVVGVGQAEPGRRVIEVARDLGASATVQSICDASFERAIVGITSQLSRVIRRRACR